MKEKKKKDLDVLSMEKVLSFHKFYYSGSKRALGYIFNILIKCGCVHPRGPCSSTGSAGRPPVRHHRIPEATAKSFRAGQSHHAGSQGKMFQKDILKFPYLKHSESKIRLYFLLLFSQPPKKDYVNYKVYQQMIKEKKSKEKDQEANTVGRRLSSRALVCVC